MIRKTKLNILFWNILLQNEMFGAIIESEKLLPYRKVHYGSKL